VAGEADGGAHITEEKKGGSRYLHSGLVGDLDDHIHLAREKWSHVPESRTHLQ
jgi:hypothetical protein